MEYITPSRCHQRMPLRDRKAAIAVKSMEGPITIQKSIVEAVPPKCIMLLRAELARIAIPPRIAANIRSHFMMNSQEDM